MTKAAMKEPELANVSIDLIDIEDGFNARKTFDLDELEGLTATVEDYGTLQTVRLRPGPEGRYFLVAGERRYRAAKAAGRSTVPAMIGDLTDAEARAVGLIENLQRSNLTSIEKGEGIKAVAQESSLVKVKDIAARLGLDARDVGLHLRLLKLPRGVQELIASGHVPIGAEKPLREVAAVSPRVAECVCEYARREGIKGREFIDEFVALLRATAEARFANPPTMIDMWRPKLSDLVPDKKIREELRLRINTATEVEFDDPAFSYGEEELIAARAAGCLIEVAPKKGTYGRSLAFLTDQEFATDLALRDIERLEKEAIEQREAAEKERKAQAENGEDADSPEARAAEERKARHAEGVERKENAILFNDELGGNLMTHRGGKVRKQRALVRTRAMAKLLIAQNPEMAARGLRLVVPGLRTDETKVLKSGKKGAAKVSYAGTEVCVELLEKRVDAARTVEELTEVMAEALVAAVLADPAATTMAAQVYWTPETTAVEKLLLADIKDVRPRRRAVKRRK